jgi:hypothetical protein
LGTPQQKDPRDELERLVENYLNRTLSQEINKRLFQDPKITQHFMNWFDKSNLKKDLEKELKKLGASIGESLHLSDKQVKGIAGSLGAAYSAYTNADPLGGAIQGYKAAGPVGAAIGLFAGILGQKKIDKWQRHKFEDAKKAQEKPFFLGFDRGDEELYNMPESAYFRTGAQWAHRKRKITVYIGNEQLDDHIRGSLTNSYASQLERGLVF